MKKLLIIYYSWSCGNTKRIAEMLKGKTNADIERIDTVVPYKGSYNDVVEQGQDEVNRNYKPEIKALVHNLNDYEVIAVGSPTWWYTMAPAVKTFLESNDFKDKTFIPFTTNGGWPGHAIKDMEKSAKGSITSNPIQIQFDSNGKDDLITSESKINNWIDEVKKLLED